MKNTLTILDVLEKAIHKEIEAQELYRDLAEKVTEEAGKDMFRELVKVEKKHEELLRRYRRGELGESALKPEHVIDYKIVEHLDQPEITADMKLDEILLLAASREKASHDFYLELAAVHPPGNVKTLLVELATQELGHKQRVEFLYTEVAFPQTDGG
jgi:rubrerythrin